MDSERPRFADAHVHISEDGFSDRYPDVVNADLLFGCTARESEWEGMRSCDIPGAVKFYGIHPWYADEWDDHTEERLESILASDPNAHVGEIGMDSKRGNVSVQRPVLDAQLDIASESHRMANIHMVGCERDVLESIRKHGRGCRTVILHSFSSESYVKPFAEAGCMFSINPRILARSDARISRFMSSIPADRLLLETDAPYGPRDFDGMRGFAERLGKASGMDAGRMIGIALENARRIADV